MSLSGAEKLEIRDLVLLQANTVSMPMEACLTLRLKDDFGLDSLDLFELALKVEDIIPGFDSRKLEFKNDETFGSMLDKIEALTNAS